MLAQSCTAALPCNYTSGPPQSEKTLPEFPKGFFRFVAVRGEAFFKKYFSFPFLYGLLLARVSELF